MNSMPCKREAEIIHALHSGSWPAELLGHKQQCPDCRQALHVSQALRSDAATLQLRSGPPAAMPVWAAVRRRQKIAALDRATRLLSALKIAGLLYALVFIAWSLRSLPALAGVSVLPGLNGKALTDSIAGAAFAVVCICSGLWYALRRDRLPKAEL
jgi:hypothetical protein